MSGPLRAVLLAAALLLAWAAGRSELIWRDWQAWRLAQREGVAGAQRSARWPTGAPGATGGEAARSAGALAAADQANARAAGDEALLRALAILAGALAEREAGASAPARPAGPVPAAARADAERETVRALAGLARDGAADRAALAAAVEALARALADREAQALRLAGTGAAPGGAMAAPDVGAAAGGPAAATPGNLPAGQEPGPALAGQQAGTRPDDGAGRDAQAAAWTLADRGYAALRAGDRQAAAQHFRGALALAPDHPEARAWAAEERRLTRRLRLEAYSLLRAPAPTPAGPVAATPVLGGASVALSGALRPWPLARRPVEAYVRYAVGEPGQPAAADTGQLAIGLAWQPLPGRNAALAAERLIAAGPLARDDWALRLAGGREARLRGVTLSGYGEAGLIPAGGDWFAGGQASAELRGTWRSVRWAAGAGLWAAGQATGADTIGRVDVGPLLRVAHPAVPAMLQIDWRLRAAGEAEPGSGPAVTVSASF